MDDNSRDRLTLARRFLEPSNSTHRQYEALRAFFVEGVPSAEAAARFGYTPGSFRVLVHQFRNQPERDFFIPTARERSTAWQAEAAAGTGRRAAEAEPLRPRHQPRPRPRRRVAQSGGHRRDLEGGRLRQAAATARRRAARPTPPRGRRCGRRPRARPDAAQFPHQVRRPVPVPPVADCPPTWTSSSRGPDSPARRWSRPRAPCGRCWH